VKIWGRLTPQLQEPEQEQLSPQLQPGFPQPPVSRWVSEEGVNGGDGGNSPILSLEMGEGMSLQLLVKRTLSVLVVS
jgi:hypothetical protein